ncbi:MAG: thioredoxin [Chlorobi bacterium]|nr:thioredoxin [Chlorobiota bacterium]
MYSTGIGQDELKFWEEEVEKASYEKPVIVDFWAPWCGPCQYIGPVLERLHAQSGGKWKLVKVNVDEMPVLAQKFGIRSIPTIKAFYKGQEIDSIMGALPEPQLRQWIENLLPDSSAQQIKQILQDFEKGNITPEHISTLEGLYAKDPSNLDVKFLLARASVLDNPQFAKTLLNGFDEAYEHYLKVKALQKLAEFLSSDPEQLPEGSVKDIMKRVHSALKEKNLEEAIKLILDALMEDKGYANGLPKDVGLGIFAYLGDENPLTQKYRRRFNMLLF